MSPLGRCGPVPLLQFPWPRPSPSRVSNVPGRGRQDAGPHGAVPEPSGGEGTGAEQGAQTLEEASRKPRSAPTLESLDFLGAHHVPRLRVTAGDGDNVRARHMFVFIDLKSSPSTSKIPAFSLCLMSGSPWAPSFLRLRTTDPRHEVHEPAHRYLRDGTMSRVYVTCAVLATR